MGPEHLLSVVTIPLLADKIAEGLRLYNRIKEAKELGDKDLDKLVEEAKKFADAVEAMVDETK